MKTALNRFSPLSLRNGKTLRNRVVIPPMASETSRPDGHPTQRTFHHYARLAEASVGLLMVEYTFVHISGRSEEFQLGADTDSKIEGLSEIRGLIHKSGALAGIQLTHSGGKTERELTGGVIMGASAISVPVKDKVMEVPTAMTLEDIKLWKDSFLAAVQRAVDAGFDLVEFHAAHGYGLNQFLSPTTNQRQDEYGGSVRKNARLLFEIIQETRLRHPDLLLAVRMPGQDFTEGGLTQEDSAFIAKELEELGVDIVDVSSGIGGWRRPRSRSGEGYLVVEAALIQTQVSLPVIGVGGIETGHFIDEAISSGMISLAAVGRAILSDPRQWGQNNLQEYAYAHA